jgi:hypothetical protein
LSTSADLLDGGRLPACTGGGNRHSTFISSSPDAPNGHLIRSCLCGSDPGVRDTPQSKSMQDCDACIPWVAMPMIGRAMRDQTFQEAYARVESIYGYVLMRVSPHQITAAIYREMRAIDAERHRREVSASEDSEMRQAAKRGEQFQRGGATRAEIEFWTGPSGSSVD